jgi:hypothetical protein
MGTGKFLMFESHVTFVTQHVGQNSSSRRIAKKIVKRSYFNRNQASSYSQIDSIWEKFERESEAILRARAESFYR